MNFQIRDQQFRKWGNPHTMLNVLVSFYETMLSREFRIKARCHYQSFPSKTLSKKTYCCHYQSFLIIFVKKIGGKNCKHEKMTPTLTNYENIAVTLCLKSIAILRRRLRDHARVRRRATRSWLLRRKQRSAYNTLLKELHTEDPNEFRNYFRMDKTTFKMLLE